MKLVTDFDLYNAIRDINEPMNLIREYRHTPQLFYAGMGIYGITRLSQGANALELLSNIALGEFIGQEILLITKKKLKKKDPDYVDDYTKEARERLKRLLVMLKEINVSTDYDMLLKSELYERHFKFESNENGIIPVKEEKFIYVPSYGFDGKEKETSILQEHNIGSSNYILSVAEPEKKYRRVLVNNQA